MNEILYEVKGTCIRRKGDYYLKMIRQFITIVANAFITITHLI